MKNGGKNLKNQQTSVKFIAEKIIENALNLHATDVHIEPKQDKVIVRLRIHGMLKNFSSLPLEKMPELAAHFKQLANLNQNEKTFPQIATIQYGQARIRISTTPMFLGEKVTLRLMRARSSVRTIKQIGLWGKNLRLTQKALRQPRGVIITIGDGRNTTNFALLNELNCPEKNLVTVEKTIEKIIPGINQTAINPKIGLGYPQTLKSALSQNPDIILVDNVCDKATAELAFEAALNGKLIIMSIPVARSIDAIPFLIHLGIQPFMISSNLLAIIGQTLVRTLPKSCLEFKPLNQAESNFILNEFGVKIDKLHNLEKSFSTEKKLNTSKTSILQVASQKEKTEFTGSTGLFEVISLIEGEIGKQLQRFILLKPTAGEIKELLEEHDFTSLKVDGLVKSLQAKTSIKEIMRRTGL